jgi:predicted protein tyrosine phosphatase
MKSHAVHVLFVCTMNKWRSPTAEKVYAKNDLVHARSGGTRKNAVRSINAGDLKWADVVLVMEEKHKQQLKSRFPGDVKFSKIRVLDIPDEYQFMDPEFVEMIQETADPILAEWINRSSS